MSRAPETIQCRCPLADGSTLTVTATRRPRDGRAAVKCGVPDEPRLAERMQQVVRLARLTEPGFDSRDQVVLSLDRRPPAGERGWELAAVLADRMVRGQLRPDAAPAANGWSDEWERGRVAGHTLGAQPANAALLGGEGGLPHLGMLAGRADPGAAVSRSACILSRARPARKRWKKSRPSRRLARMRRASWRCARCCAAPATTTAGRWGAGARWCASMRPALPAAPGSWRW
jgi:hypothetical protein